MTIQETDNPEQGLHIQKSIDILTQELGMKFVEATQDPKLKQYNQSVYSKMVNMISEAKLYGEVFGIFFINLDRFKLVNQRWGYEIGNRLLYSIGEALQKRTRYEDVVARVDGDQFIVFIRHILSEEKSYSVAERLLSVFQSPFSVDGNEITVNASLGIALYPFDSNDLSSLIRNSVKAMFKSKIRGGCGFDIHSRPFNPSLQRKMEPKVSQEKTVMIIDDDPDFQRLLVKSLQRAGYRCMPCSSVEDALFQIQHSSPDLVMLDLSLKKASGFAFLENFSQIMAPLNKKVPPVIVVSGYDDLEIVDCAKSFGARQFIPKPVTSSKIVSAVNSFLH